MDNIMHRTPKRVACENGVMLIAKITHTAFMVWLICVLFVFLESLWESRKNKILK